MCMHSLPPNSWDSKNLLHRGWVITTSLKYSQPLTPTAENHPNKNISSTNSSHKISFHGTSPPTHKLSLSLSLSRTHTCMHAHTHTHACMYTRTHTHTHTHTYTHTHTHLSYISKSRRDYDGLNSKPARASYQRPVCYKAHADVLVCMVEPGCDDESGSQKTCNRS